MANSQFENLINLARRDLQMLCLAMTNPALQSPGLFHAQQAIEKAFKAVLSASNHPYPLTHNLPRLKKALTDIGIDCAVEDEILEKNPAFRCRSTVRRGYRVLDFDGRGTQSCHRRHELG